MRRVGGWRPGQADGPSNLSDGVRPGSAGGAALFVLTAVSELFQPNAATRWWAPAFGFSLALILFVVWLITGVKQASRLVERYAPAFVTVFAIACCANPILMMVQVGRAFPSVYMVLAILAVGSQLHHSKLAASMIAASNLAWIVCAIFIGLGPTSPVVFAIELVIVDSVAVIFHVNGKRTVDRLELSREVITAMAEIDGLTGIKNQRALLLRGKEHFDRAVEEGTGLTVLYMDVNGLKQLNDTQGHAAGDRLIRQVAEVLVHATRAQDVVGRIGGDEFAVVIGHDEPNLDDIAIIDRIRTRLTERGCEVSIGVARLDEAPEGATFDDLMHLADTEMYVHKMRHRNQ